MRPSTTTARPGGFRGWRDLAMTSDGLRLLQDLRRSLLDPPCQLWPRAVTAIRDDGRATSKVRSRTCRIN